jgi:uncharacterized SAM-binding protein YcdF (DUF218 family)
MSRQDVPRSAVGRGSSRAVRRARNAALFVLLCLFVLSVAGLVPAARQAGSGDVRVAVVLGNGPKATDEPTAVQTARCLKAFELYKKGAVNKLLVTGGFTFDYISEARMMKIALVTWGVPPDDVVEEDRAATTIENGSFSARLFEERGWTKNAFLVSQASHLARADKIFETDGFNVEDAASAEAAAGPEDFAQLPDMKPGAALKVEPSDQVVVYEPYRGLEPMEWPTPALAHRLRTAAALYHAKAAPALVACNDPYTRGPINIAQMMKVALISLGVPAASIKAIGRREYRRLADVVAASGDKSATLLAPAAAKPTLGLDGVPKWKLVFVD